MVRPERRTRTDLVATALLVVAVLVAAVVLWRSSDARATVYEPTAPMPNPAPATGIPTALKEAWRAPSPATPVPVVAGPAVVTGAGGEVLGRDPATGEPRWRYSRDLPLCTVGTEWDHAIAVHRGSHNCSEVSTLVGSTGERGPQRTTDAEYGTRLLGDGTYVTTSGNMVESWRSDLVRTQQYGVPPDPRNPNNNLDRPECRRTSVAVGDSKVAVIEKCPRETIDRLTVLEARPEDDEEPEEVFSTGIDSTNSTAVAVNRSGAAVAAWQQGQLLVYDADGDLKKRYPLPRGSSARGNAPATASTAPDELRALRLDPSHSTDPPEVARSLAKALRPVDPSVTEEAILSDPTQVARLSEADYERVDDEVEGLPGVFTSGIRYWYTGTATVALDSSTLRELWTMPDTLGAGMLYAGRLLVPVPEGLAVVDPSTGEKRGMIPVDRRGYTGPVELDSAGAIVLERRGDTLVALRPGR